MATNFIFSKSSKRFITTTVAHKPQFKSLCESSRVEWDHCVQEYNKGVIPFTSKYLTNLILSQRGDDKKFGFGVDLYEHQLQTATRAHKDGAPEEIVVMALFHDAAEYLSPHNHAHTIGHMLYPYLSPKSFWILSHHDIFQSFYFLHHHGREPDALRSQFKDHSYYADTVYFCENYDQNSFDDSYSSYPLEYFEKMIDGFFNKEPFWWNDGKNPIHGNGKLM